MKRAILLITIAIAAWQGYTAHADRAVDALAPSPSQEAARETARELSPAAQAHAGAVGRRCDGRTHCSQMTSCSEATWFLRNCAGTQMDGDGDGVPCERQWCR